MSSQSTDSGDEVAAQPFNEIELLASTQALESIALLRACVAPAAAVAQYQEALRWSSFSQPFSHWMALLESVGTQQLAGHSVNAADALQTAPGKEQAIISRVLSLVDERGDYHVKQTTDASTALHIANVLSPRDVSLRRRAANQGELAGLPEQFLPPTGAERLQQLLEDWQQFVRRGAADMHPLLLMGVAHCQLMCIRPFTFSNTATVHIIDQRLLKEEGVLDAGALLPMAWQFSHRSGDYWSLQIDAVRQQAWEPWLLFFLQKITDCANRSTQQLHALNRLYDRFVVTIEQQLASVDNAHALARVCVQPSCGIGDVVDAGVAKRQTSAIYLGKLVESGLLRESRVGKEKRFINDTVLALLLDEV